MRSTDLVTWKGQVFNLSEDVFALFVAFGGRLFPDLGSFRGGSDKNIFASVHPMGILKHPPIFKKQVLGLSVTIMLKGVFCTIINQLFCFLSFHEIPCYQNACKSTNYGKHISYEDE